MVEIRPLYTRPADPQILRAQLAAIRAARREILIEQAYVSDDAIVAALVAARRRGVDVRVILPTRGDSGFMNSANLIATRAFLKNGVRVYAYPGMTHVKVALYDGWAIVGSANFDKLSLRVNGETCIATSDPGFVGRCDATCSSAISRARRKSRSFRRRAGRPMSRTSSPTSSE